MLPYCLPSIGEEEIQAVNDVMRSGWIVMGEKTLEFERLLTEYTGAKYCVCVNSCTAALHLSLLALDIGLGDEVITTPFTFASTAHVIDHTGAMVVFADINKHNYNIDPEQIERKIVKGRTKAIIPVHYAGLPCDMDSIMTLARKYNLFVIEDAAHAIGASYNGRKIGSIGDATCFSFYATKNITTGEGGAILTNNEALANRARTLRLHGMTRDAWKRYSAFDKWHYEVAERGWKYVTTDMESAIGIVQLKKLDSFIEKRKEIASLYDEALQNYGIVPLKDDNIYHLYPFLVEDRQTVMKKLSDADIGYSVHFIPLHYQQAYRGYGCFPNAEWVYKRELSLPLYPKMTDEDVERVIKAIC